MKCSLFKKLFERTGTLQNELHLSFMDHCYVQIFDKQNHMPK